MRYVSMLAFVATFSWCAIRAAAQPAPAPSPGPSPAPSAAAQGERRPATSFNGYIQARATLTPDGQPESNLFVRRARLGARHTFGAGRIVLSFDGGQNTVGVRDAYLDLFLRKGGERRTAVTVRAGQFFRPFGFEIERSSNEREFPERPAAWGVLFPGNRDQGVNVSVTLPSTGFDVALLNGNGTTGVFRDVDAHKDVLLRARQTLAGKRVTVAGSLYLGRQRLPGVAAQAPQRGFVDANDNGVQDPGEAAVVVSPGRPGTPAIDGERDRWGVALHVTRLAGGDLRAEYVGARDLTSNLASGAAQGTADADAFFAFYARPVVARVVLGVRYDEFDPDTSDVLRLQGDGEQRTFGVVLLRDVAEHLRLAATWERPRLTTYDRARRGGRSQASNVWTLQIQGRF